MRVPSGETATARRDSVSGLPPGVVMSNRVIGASGRACFGLSAITAAPATAPARPRAAQPTHDRDDAGCVCTLCGDERLILEHEQGGRDVADALVVVLHEASFEQRADRRRERSRQCVPRRVALDDCRQRFARVGAFERAPAGEHLEEHAAEGPDVAAFVGRASSRLLGAHVGRGTENHANPRQHGRRRDGRRVQWIESAGWRGLGRLGQAEIEHLRAIVCGQRDVRGLEIAVDDSLFVC